MKTISKSTTALTFAICLFSYLGFSQDLPNRLTPSEKLQIPAYGKRFSTENKRVENTNPPISKVRTMAEWEELQGLMIAWKSYPSMLRDIIKAVQHETKVYIVTTDSATVASNLLNNGVDTFNVRYLVKPFNSVWIRDYGPWSIYKNDIDSLFTVDWIYNRPRYDDDKVPQYIANKLGTPLYQLTSAPNQLVNTGGNFMTDGLGTGFASKLVLDENKTEAGFGVNHTEAEIDTIMNRFMGIDRYIKMTNLPYDEIHHIDMHMKLLDEETLLVGKYPEGVSDGPQIEANLKYIQDNFLSVFGTPYKVIRIPMPADKDGLYPDNFGQYFTYTNSSFVNKTIIVPIYDVPTDTTALGIYREALPGYNVVGIYSNQSIAANGALHCITKEIGTADPLLIVHQPLTNTLDTNRINTLTAKIQHKSGIKNAKVYFRTDNTQTFESVPLTFTNENNAFTGTIPTIKHKKMQYYIEAEANSGKTQMRPLPAPKATWTFQVGNLEINTIAGPNTITGIENYVPDFQIGNIYPNPSKGISCISFQSQGIYLLEITVNDLMGNSTNHLVNGHTSIGQNNQFINTSASESGIYVIEIRIDTKVYRQKLFVR